MPRYWLDRRDDSPFWYIFWTERRRTKRRSTGTADREQAELVKAAFILERGRKRDADPEETGVAAVLNDYYEKHASRLPSKAQAKIAIDRLIGFYGVSAVSRISAASHDDYIALRRKAGVGDETISRELSVLRAALNRAVKYGWLSRAPQVPSLPKSRPRERVLTRTEAARLLCATRRKSKWRHVGLFIRLCLYTGARPGAILDLTWDRVDFERRLIDLTLPGRTETNKRRAVVPFFGALYTALERAKARARTPHVIEYAGEPVKSVRRAFREACGEAGLEGVTRYTMRHTAASWAAMGGASGLALARFLGHSRASTTERYIKYTPDYMREVGRLIARGAPQPRPKGK